MTATAHDPVLLACGRAIEAGLHNELRAILSEQNVHVSQDIITAIMPRVRDCIGKCIDSSAGYLLPEGSDISPVHQTSTISGYQVPIVTANELQIRDQKSELSNKSFPQWFSAFLSPPHNATLLCIPEWQDPSYRQSNGWRGADYVHSSAAPARVDSYALLPPSSDATYPSLVGIAVFTPACESHKLFCHGGAACALFDDAVGWMGFCHTGTVTPWSGFTAQVNTSLKRPVRAGCELMLKASVREVDGRKVWVDCELVDPVTGVMHCSGSGLYLRNRDSSSGDAAVPAREVAGA